jgi:endonuclease-3
MAKLKKSKTPGKKKSKGSGRMPATKPRVARSRGGIANPTTPKRVAAILAKLDEAYPAATCELKHENPFQLLISTILSAQCTDVRVNMLAATLHKKYPDAKAFAYAKPAELEQEIRPTGFSGTNQIDHGCEQGDPRKFWRRNSSNDGGNADAAGGGAQNCERGAGNGLRHSQRVVVDTHVQRLSNRLELTKNQDPKRLNRI